MLTTLFVCVSIITHSQSKPKYDIFLLLDSDKKEMLVNSTFVENDLIFRIYSILKNIPKEKGYNVHLGLTKKGKFI